MQKGHTMNYTYDEIFEMAKRIDPRTELLKEGHNAIYFDENMNKDDKLDSVKGKDY